MAAQGNNLQTSGGMDISEHRKTWKLFIRLVKATMILVLGIMVFLMIFRTH